MTDAHLAAEEYVDKAVYDPTGTFLGTVADVDAEAGVLYVDPDPDPTEESWAEVDEGEFVNFDNNWLGIPDYKVWEAGDGGEVDFQEWPYTIGVVEVDEVTAEAVHLERMTLTDFLKAVTPFFDSER